MSSFNRASDGTVSTGTISITLYNATDGTTSALFDADSVAATDKKGILDTQSTTTNGGVDYTVANLDISALTDSADDLADLDEMISTVDAGGVHDDDGGHLARLGQVAHRHPEDVREQPHGRHQDAASARWLTRT